jgi:putative oxidoreductase
VQKFSIVARYMLAFVFTTFGLNGFLHFIPLPTPPGPLAGQYIELLMVSHYMVPVFALQVICGVLFLLNRFVPLALTLIAPVIVNMLLFHALMAPSGIAPAAFTAVFWLIVFYNARSAFAGIFQRQMPQYTRSEHAFSRQ